MAFHAAGKLDAAKKTIIRDRTQVGVMDDEYNPVLRDRGKIEASLKPVYDTQTQKQSKIK